MTHDYQALANDLNGALAKLHKEIPATIQGFSMMAKPALQEGALSAKDKELIAENIEREMKEAAKNLDFERAMELRDILFELKENKK